MPVSKLSTFTKNRFELRKFFFLIWHYEFEHVYTRPFVNLIQPLAKLIEVFFIHHQNDKLTLRFTLRPVK